MIAEIRFKNVLSFRDEAVFSFEADKDKEMESFHVVEVITGIRLLKFAVIYGANASGKSNFIKICDFLKKFLIRVPAHKNEETGILPFLLDKPDNQKPSELSVTFYAWENEKMTKFVYRLILTKSFIIHESLQYYPGQQPATVFERTLANNVSAIHFGNKIKLTSAAKEEISLKCLSNMSVFAAYMQVNVNIPEIETVLWYFSEQVLPTVTPVHSLEQYSDMEINLEEPKGYILQYLQEADFNISDISPKEDTSSDRTSKDIIFQHKVKDDKGNEAFYEFPQVLESDGTIRTMGLAGCIRETIANDAFLAVDEIESSLHPKLIEYIIERFLKDSKQAQLLVTTHYDGLLGEDDLIRKDSVWFTEKKANGSTELYPLTEFKGLNRISSLQKAYKFGKFGAIPNL